MKKELMELTSPIVNAILRTRPYLITDADGNIVFANELAVKILAGTPSHCNELARINSDCDEIILQIFVNAQPSEQICSIRMIENDGYVVMMNDKPRQLKSSEIIHQVRNGMSILHAMLELEISTAPENEINRLMVSQTRIKAMAAVYDLTTGNADTDFDAMKLLTAIVANSQSTFMQRSQVNAPESSTIKIPTKNALYFGLVVAEIAIHLAKHSDTPITISCTGNTIKITTHANLPKLPALSKTIIDGYMTKNLKGKYLVEYGETFGVELTIDN
ncbi:MAG: histidine kinase dimerization/phosphoacceptor domain -containing protein [bacterium]